MTTTTPAPPRTARSTTIFLKVLMAVSGLLFVLYVLAHMYGNLRLLYGQEAFNTYAHHLRTIGEPTLPYAGLLWIIRVVLLVAVVVHVYAAFKLWARAQSARSQRYIVKKAVVQTLSSKFMRWGGVFLLLFIIWHLLEFTIVKFNVSGKGDHPGDPYTLVLQSFQVPWLTAIYVVAMLALYMHLAHGVFSAQQTLGWTMTVGAKRRAQVIGHVIAAITVVGFLIPPVAILFGLGK